MTDNTCDLCNYNEADVKLVSVDDKDEHSRYCKGCWILMAGGQSR